MVTKSKLDHAYDMADLGLLVFPLSPNSKIPTFDSNGHQDATADKEQIKSWWDEDPDYNIGICPGPNYVVVDLDMKHGLDGVQAICDELVVDPWAIISETFTVKTTTGGYHLYYKCDEEWGVDVGVLPGIDIRGVNGYVLGPGSVLDGKSYDIYADEPIIPIREELKVYRREPGEKATKEDKIPVAGIMDSPSQIEKAREHLDVQIRFAEHPDEDLKMSRNQRISISEDGGNHALYNNALQIKDCGVSRETALELITIEGGWNDHCEPPWDIAKLVEVIDHAFTYGKQRPGSKGGGTMELFEEMYGLPLSTSNGDGPPEEPTDKFARLRGLLFRGMALTKRPNRREMIIPEWFPAQGFTAVNSRRGDGKSVLMLDIAMRVACRIGDWHGYPVSTKGWKVVYCCGEDSEGFAEQMKAWTKHHKVEPDDDKFIVMNGIMNLLKPDDVETWGEFLKEETKGENTILFVDTWQRATPSASQNDDDKMQAAVHCLERLIRHLKGPCMVASHPPKSDRGTILGSSTIENATSAILLLEQGTIGRKIWVDRMKGKGEGNYQLFKFESVGLGDLDEFGNEYTGVVPVKIGGVESDSKAKEENLKIKATFAVCVKELDLDRKNIFPDSSPFSINGAAEAISKLTDHTDIKWAERLIRMLRDVGVASFSKTRLRMALTELFIDDPTPYRFEDGNILELYKVGTHRRFRVRPDGMGDDNENSS